MTQDRTVVAARPPLARLGVPLLLLVLAAPGALGNAGVFSGSGHTVTLASSADVQLVSESVTILPGRSRGLFGGGVPRDWVDYVCEFELRNLSDEAVEVQVGFPLSSQLLGHDALTDEQTIGLVQHHRFIARDADDTYHVRFVPGDAEQRFSRLFLWTMSFAPGQTRRLHVSYGMETSVQLGTTARDWGVEAPAPWMGALSQCLQLSFSYVNETGLSWAGEVESARFRVLTGRYELALARRPLMEYERDEHGALRFDDLVPPSFWHRSVHPPGAESLQADDVPSLELGLTWDQDTLELGETIAVSYSLVGLPRTPQGMAGFCEELQGSGADLDQLREVLLAWFGVPHTSAELGPFLENQIWYEPRAGRREAELDADAAALLAVVDAARSAADD